MALIISFYRYRVLASAAYEAFYRLSDPRGQIQSYVFDVVRSTVPKLELDESFSSKEDIASDVQASLTEVMTSYGYEIRNALVTDIAPDSKVKASMNEINASKRLKEAASHKAEADKTKQVSLQKLKPYFVLLDMVVAHFWVNVRLSLHFRSRQRKPKPKLAICLVWVWHVNVKQLYKDCRVQFLNFLKK